MSGENYTNTASTATTSAPVGPADLTATLATFTGYPSQPFWAMFEKGTASAELVRVTNVAGSVVTITRGQGGTSATSHGAGVTFEHVIPADMPNRFEVHSAASTGVHGVSGSVVGTTGSQTVQDKTFRGAHVSTQSDALPAGVTSNFLSNADNSSARDGFVHNNTAGSAARAAFLLQQSGTDRFRVSNTGNVTINPSTGTALAVTGNETVSGTLGVTGALTGSSTVSAVGLSSSSGLTVSSGTSALQATTATTVSASGTIHATGALDTDSTLVVDGISTLTGAVTTGSTLAVGTGLTVAQGATSWGGRVVISVASAASVTTPTTGDVIYDRSDSMWKRWSGAAWIDMAPGDSATSHFGEYTLGTTAATQSVTAGTTVSLSVGATAIRTNSDITVGTSAAGSGSIANSAFTLARAGEYRFEYSTTYNTPTNNTLLYTFFAIDGNPGGGDWWGANRFDSGASTLDMASNGSFSHYFTAGQKVCLHLNTNKTVTVANTNRQTRVSIRYMGA